MKKRKTILKKIGYSIIYISILLNYGHFSIDGTQPQNDLVRSELSRDRVDVAVLSCCVNDVCNIFEKNVSKEYGDKSQRFVIQ